MLEFNCFSTDICVKVTFCF